MYKQLPPPFTDEELEIYEGIIESTLNFLGLQEISYALAKHALEKRKKQAWQKFGANQEAVRTQTNALYKKEGLNTGLGCVITLIHLVLSLVIFFTFYSSLRANSAYQAINQYEILEATYNEKAYEVLSLRADEIVEYDITNALYPLS